MMFVLIVEGLQCKCASACYQGWKLALTHWPTAGKFYVGPVEILSELVKCSIISIEIMWFVSCWAGRAEG